MLYLMMEVIEKCVSNCHDGREELHSNDRNYGKVRHPSKIDLENNDKMKTFCLLFRIE